ncbi:MAG TPA: YafY family protein [Anaerolineaceae bacterium]|nr:YafY family protein [Anaerolineaceae bacterium]
MSNTATRLITLIMLLQRHPNQNAAQLAKTLDVSVRTVQRYINMLDEIGIPIYAEHGPYGGYGLARGYKMAPLVFTPQEAVALHLGVKLLEEVWGCLYQDAARGALAKMENILPDEQRREVAWARQTLLATGFRRADPEGSAPQLEKLRDAAHERRRVRMLYRGRSKSEATQRDFEPYKLLHAGGWQYAVGYCHLRRSVRTFRVDRILDLTLLEQTFEIPMDFNIQDYLASDPRFQQNVRVRLVFPPEAALTARDHQPLWDALEEQPDGSVQVTYGASDLEWAANIAMRFVHEATVWEPEALRVLLRERGERIAARHTPQPE